MILNKSETMINCRSISIILIILTILSSAGCEISSSNKGNNWSHAEMIKHLKNKGLVFNTKETHSGAFHGPAMNFVFDGDEVYVQVRKTAQDAKDTASPKGDKAFAWSRFYFQGLPKRLAEIKKALL